MKISKLILATPGMEHMGQVRPRDMVHAKTSHKMILLTVMYLSQTIPMGFIMGGLPVLMRNSGMSLAAIGFLFMLHLPWALKFFYASFVDSFYLDTLGRRRSWILPMQWLAVLAFVLLGQISPGQSPVLMYLLLLAAASAMATNDIAVDGYATDMLTAKERPWGNTIQSGARSVGMVLGGGIPLILFEQMGWSFICLSMAGALLLLNLPVLFHREITPSYQPRASGVDKGSKAAGMLTIIREPTSLWLLVYLILATVFFFMGFQMVTPLLNDLGLNPRTLGWALIWCGSPLGLLGSVVGGYLYQRLGPQSSLRWCIAAAFIFLLSAMLLAGQGSISVRSGLMILGLGNLLLGLIHVWSFTVIMKASVGPESGTRFAVYGSIFLLPPLVLAPALGAFGDSQGFVTLYLLLAVLMLLGFWGAGLIAFKRLRPLLSSDDDRPEDAHDFTGETNPHESRGMISRRIEPSPGHDGKTADSKVQKRQAAAALQKNGRGFFNNAKQHDNDRRLKC